MLVAYRVSLSKLHIKQRPSSKVFLSGGNDQVSASTSSTVRPVQHLQAFRVREQSVAQVVDVLDDLELSFGAASGNAVSLEELETVEKRRLSSSEASSSNADANTSSRKRSGSSASRQKAASHQARPLKSKSIAPSFDVVASTTSSSASGSGVKSSQRIAQVIDVQQLNGQQRGSSPIGDSNQSSKANADNSLPPSFASTSSSPSADDVATSVASSSGSSQQHRKQVLSVVEALSRLEPLASASAAQSASPAVVTASEQYLTTRIISAPDPAALRHLYAKHSKVMNGIHVAAMMKKLATLVVLAPNSFKPRIQRLWEGLCHKAIFLSPMLELRQVADIVFAMAALHQAEGPVHRLEQQRDRQLEQQAVVPGKPSSKAANAKQAPLDSALSRDSRDLDQARHGVSAAGQQRPSDPLHWDGGDAPERYGHLPDAMEDVDSSGLGAPNALPMRPFAAWQRLPQLQSELVSALLLQSQQRMAAAASVRPAEAAKLACNLGRLGYAHRPSLAWLDAFFAATQPVLRQLSTKDALTLAYGLGRLVPPSAPPGWLQDFYARSQPLLRELGMRDLCNLLHSAAHLPERPPPAWIDEALYRCAELFDFFDAPAYSLALHALGLMSYRPPRAWSEELLDSCATVLHDFQPEEISLLLRGCVAARLMPDEQWLEEFFECSLSKLRSADGPRLAEIGYSLGYCMQLLPPPQWLHEYRQALSKQVAAERVGSRVHAERAMLGLQAFGEKELGTWARRLRVRMPPALPWSTVYYQRGEGAGAEGGGEAAEGQQPEGQLQAPGEGGGPAAASADFDASFDAAWGERASWSWGR